MDIAIVGAFIGAVAVGAVGFGLHARAMNKQAAKLLGAGGVADTVKCCMKSAADTYSWVTVSTG